MGEESKQEVWETVFQGRKHYFACGHRNVLIIQSNESLEGPDIVPRREGMLTSHDVDALNSQGISSEYREDDVKLMEERYRISKKSYTVIDVERNPKSVEYITAKIVAFLSNTKEPGVLIHYIGPGRKHTGDWCFNDGFITFLDLMACYRKWFNGRTMELVSDCSYSGKWRTCLENYLEREGVQPCGHSARASGIQLYLAVSCRDYEIPHQFLFSARACYNDKNTKEIAISSNTMGENQHSDVILATKLICGADKFHAPCLLADNFTWQKIHVSRNLFFTRYAENKKWELFLVIDDERIKDQIRSGQAHARDYGELIRSGEGELFSTEDKTWINTNYPGHTCF